MANPGWSCEESPFHAGELAIQARLGVQERMDKQGRRMIREYLPEQHRQFYSQLSFLIVGTVEDGGDLWASILVGEPGFISSSDERRLTIKAKPLFNDPLNRSLCDRCDMGLLGIELQSRRRNRLNGVVENIDDQGFELSVRQSFGNCPKYIQARTFQLQDFDPNEAKPSHVLDNFGEAENLMITASDTFFIATAYQDSAVGIASGVDVSHRGGKPGFVRVDDDKTLTIPDFLGNYHFNTFGNLELNPHAGLLFIDFVRGDLLYLTGTAEVLWQDADVSNFAGAERLLRFYLQRGYRVEGSLPLRWSEPNFSPFLNGTGSWSFPESVSDN